MRVQWPSTAFVDESRSDQTYVLAAVVVEDRVQNDVRQVCRELKLGDVKLHWTKEAEPRRAEILQVVTSLDLIHTVVLRVRQTSEPDERARRMCLRRLLWELDLMDVERIVFEARERSQNASDMRLIAHLRQSREVKGLRADHQPGPSEPLLWLPDVVAGAMRAHHARAADYAELARRVSLIEL